MTTTTKTYWNYIVFMQTTLHVEIFLPFFSLFHSIALVFIYAVAVIDVVVVAAIFP